jgi:hypothetical protein
MVAAAGLAEGPYGYYGPQRGSYYAHQNLIITDSSEVIGKTNVVVRTNGDQQDDIAGIHTIY